MAGQGREPLPPEGAPPVSGSCWAASTAVGAGVGVAVGVGVAASAVGVGVGVGVGMITDGRPTGVGFGVGVGEGEGCTHSLVAMARVTGSTHGPSSSTMSQAPIMSVPGPP